MLLPPTSPTLPAEDRRKAEMGDVSMTDDYGEPSGSQRTLGGGVDYFSSLGTDMKKQPERPAPDKVFTTHLRIILTDCIAACDELQRDQQGSELN